MLARPFNPVGPRKAEIAIVGESLGEEEMRLGAPFVGASGQELTRMLEAVGIDREQCYITNVFWQQPPNNNIQSWTVGARDIDASYTAKPIKVGANKRYFHSQFLTPNERVRGLYDLAPTATVIDRLTAELAEVNPNIVIALGAIASWALINRSGIGSARGYIFPSEVTTAKVLPTYHPAGVLRNWSWRVLCLADFSKALKHSKDKALGYTARKIYINPTLEDLEWFWREHISKTTKLALDIEGYTAPTSISFATSKDHCLVVPLIQDNELYWSPKELPEALKFIQKVLASDITKITHNGLYDLPHLIKDFGFKIKNATEDTLLIHHALQPELLKGLGFLASIYLNERAWKEMSPMKAKEEIADK